MKIALGMSGGVDSSVCAALLRQAGHEVTGVFLECWRGPGCRAEEDRKDALGVALDLNIPFQVLDFKSAYKQRVVDLYLHDLTLGLTPNPDVWCNTEIKFGLFYDWALANGFDAIATGHYAQILTDSHGQKHLHSAPDFKKDQTYFLYRTAPEQLEHIVFPIGHLTKPQVRELAKEFNLPTAKKPDSQGICFIGDIDVREFVREHLGTKLGQVLDTEGNIVGEHDGVWFFTVGQRHGFRLHPKIQTKDAAWKHILPPLYVISKDATANTITVGYGAETVRTTFTIADLAWRQTPDFSNPTTLRVRLRHGGELLPVLELTPLESNSVQITLATAQRGISPGQAAVLYGLGTEPICWGGGVVVS